MAHHVFLEIGPDGRTMAHVSGLPGCMARGETREDALAGVPRAIRDYANWLARHGEEAPVRGTGFEIAGERQGWGPFDPGDKAALFPPDREPLTQRNMERLLRLMAHSREDLMTVIEGIPPQVLGEEYAKGWPIDRILRHIGGAEVWYVTRIAHTWNPDGFEEHRASGDVSAWLTWSREAVVGRLSSLSEGELSLTFYPTHYTDHPDEAWTARKVFRRFLEHEREHTAQIQRLLE